MKKSTLIFTVLFIVKVFTGFSQPNFYTRAPFGVTTTQVRAPNGISGYAYLRACALVLQSELTNISVTNNTITAFGFTLSAGTNTSTPPVGNFTVYLQNTSDVTYQKGTNWSTIITGMTEVYASTMTVPGSAGTASVSLTLSTPFVYTGGGIYVAYDWYSAGPYSGTPATYWAEGSTLVPGCASGNSASSAPTSLGTTAFRPNYLFGTPNTLTNEVSVTGLDAIGRLAGSLTTTNVVTTTIRNGSGITMNNIPISLNVSGANPFTNTITVSSLASGASTTVTFPVMTPTNSGVNSLTVSVPSDQNNTNNSMTYTQSITCNEWALNPAGVSYTLGSLGFNTGTGIVGVTYTNPVTSTLSALRLGISNEVNTPGGVINGVLLNSAGSVLATTNTLTITNSMLGTFQTFSFSPSQVLSPNTQYYLGIAQNTHTATLGYFPVGTYTTSYVPFTNYATFALSGGVPAPLTSNLGYMSIDGIFVPSQPTVSISSPTVVCGSSPTLTNSAFSYTWAGGPTNSNYIVTPTVTSTYSLNYADSYSCLGSVTASVFVNPISVNATGAATICAGKSVSLSVSGDATDYNWNSGQNGVNISVSPSVNTTYIVTGTNSAGCSNTSTVSVSVNSLPIISVNSGSICAGQSFTMVPSGAATYTYSNGSDVVSPSVDATFTVTGTDANGCVSVTGAVSSVSVNALPIISVNSGTICSGQSFTMAPSGAVTYTYSNGSDVVSPSADATYTVTGTDANGCENTAVSSVTVNTLPTISVNSGSICAGGSFTMVPSGASTYTYSNGTDVVAPTVDATYTVTGTDANGCVSATGAVSTVTVNALPTISVVTNNTLLCVGQTATLTASGTATSYTWSTTDNTSAITVTPSVQTTYTIEGTGANGCLNATTITQNVSACTGIENVASSASANVLIYPNPNNGLFVIELTSASNVTVMNALGQVVISETFEAGKHNLDIHNEATGVYFVKVMTNNKQQIIKVIKE